MVKVRLQLGATGSPLAIAGRIISEEGVGALYKGLSAGLVRQATYTTARYVWIYICACVCVIELESVWCTFDGGSGGW